MKLSLFKNNLVLLVTDVSIFCRVKRNVADRRYQRIDTEGEVCKEEVCPCARGKSFRLEGRVIDDEASDETKEEG